MKIGLAQINTTVGHLPRNQNIIIDALKSQKIDLHFNLSASPWNMGKNQTQEDLVTSTTQATDCPLIYVNAVGGNDELVFDERSMVANAPGLKLPPLAFGVGRRIPIVQRYIS